MYCLSGHRTRTLLDSRLAHASHPSDQTNYHVSYANVYRVQCSCCLQSMVRLDPPPKLGLETKRLAIKYFKSRLSFENFTSLLFVDTGCKCNTVTWQCSESQLRRPKTILAIVVVSTFCLCHSASIIDDACILLLCLYRREMLQVQNRDYFHLSFTSWLTSAVAASDMHVDTVIIILYHDHLLLPASNFKLFAKEPTIHEFYANNTTLIDSVPDLWNLARISSFMCPKTYSC